MFQVDVLQGPVNWGGVVDLRIPRCKYSLTTSNFSHLIVQEMEREVLEPKKNFGLVRRYLHLVAYWATMWDRKHSREDARLSAYTARSSSEYAAPNPECSSSTNRQTTNRQSSYHKDCSQLKKGCHLTISTA